MPAPRFRMIAVCCTARWTGISSRVLDTRSVVAFAALLTLGATTLAGMLVRRALALLLAAARLAGAAPADRPRPRRLCFWLVSSLG